MYIWIACDLSDSLGHVREECRNINKGIGLDEVPFLLPQHISLKISFDAPEHHFDAIISDVIAYLSEIRAFFVKGPSAELCGGILWLRFDGEAELIKIHRDLDRLLSGKYAIPQHEFDKCFAFHSTLFISEDREKLGQAYARVLNVALPEQICVNNFVIGTSKSGKAGEYHVTHKIKCKK